MRIEETARPDPGMLAGVEQLVNVCRAADGAAILPADKSLHFDPEMPSWFLAREGAELVGALSVFAPRREEAEVSALVRPDRRRRGVFTALLAATEQRLGPYGFHDELLLCDRSSAAGVAVARRLGAALAFTEYSMRQGWASPPSAPAAPAGFAVAEVGLERLAELVALRAEAFGDTPENGESMTRTALDSPDRKELCAFLDGHLVGACSLAFEGRSVSINGLAVASAHRGRGLGKAFLAAIVQRFRGAGLDLVIDVESTNQAALRAYLASGFEVVSAVDYHRRPFPRAAGR
jgi:GNAT superfamily N-acetyltransferase